ETIFNTAITNYWVKVSNSCGSANSRSVTVTVNCVPPIPRITAPPVNPSTKPFTVSWTGDSRLNRQYDLDEAKSADFTQGLRTFTITDGTSKVIPAHTEVSADMRFYYRVRAYPQCGGIGN